ncbi:6-bladed beta-propeller [Bacteroides fragilis]|uniref:6-bladed beta-propeller n=2 Tax=Bacteroides fragilis TaxID=817 RepID=UPI000ED1697D|nr:6-bladed beta-propeller [Bacteroides fragilis]RGN12047.1 6-bladed beta-propeller [Bacteroides fragilis]
MRIMLILGVMILGFMACSNKKTVEPNPVVLDNIIHLSTAIKNVREEMMLSELVDSVSYVPLETKSNCMLGNTQRLTFSPQYIFYSNYCFDWNGRFLFRIGNQGQGACEDIYVHVADIVYLNNHFYGNASKIIEYDDRGKCTGKELSWYAQKTMDTAPVGRMVNKVCFAPAGENLMFYNFPDTVYFINTDYEFVAKRSMMPWNRKGIAPSMGSVKYTSYYKDTTLFYNFYTDTVFTVTPTSLVPRWVVELDEELRFPTRYLYEDGLLSEAFKCWESGNLENAKMIKLLDHKYMVSGVFETERFVFLLVYESMPFRELRKVPDTPPLIAIYNKRTGETFAVKQVVDDLGGMKAFFPSWGAYNEKLLATIWPYKLKEFIEEEQSAGRTVAPQILNLMKRVREDDNPILIIANLKTK